MYPESAEEVFGLPQMGGLRGVWPPFLEIGQNRPFSPFFCLFSPFSGRCEELLQNPENGGKKAFSSDILRFA